MAVTSRLGLTLLEQGQAGSEIVLDTDLNLLDAGSALLEVANTFSAANVFSGSLHHTGSQFGVFGAALASQPANTVDLVDGLETLGLRAAGPANVPCDLGTGTFQCGLIAGTSFGGHNVPYNYASTQVTFLTDANITLAVPALTAAYIDIQTDAVLTTTRDIIVPLGIGNLWIVRNRNAQAIRIIGATGTGTTVASGRIAILLGSGANVIRVSPDQIP